MQVDGGDWRSEVGSIQGGGGCHAVGGEEGCGEGTTVQYLLRSSQRRWPCFYSVIDKLSIFFFIGAPPF